MRLSVLVLCVLAILFVSGPVAAIPQDDINQTLQNLKDAEAKKDPALVKKLAADTVNMAHQILVLPEPTATAAHDDWVKQQESAHAAVLYTEYALFATGIQAPPAGAVDLISTLEQQNPKSKYLDEAYGYYFAALRQTGATAKIPGIAEAALVNFPDNEDLLLVLADHALTAQQNDRALHYASHLLSVLPRHARPENVSAGAWEQKRASMAGVAHWIAGIVESQKNHYMDGDKDLRAALTYVRGTGNKDMLGETLFYLGVDNFQLGKLLLKKDQVLEGVKFSEQAAAVPGRYADQAWHNVAAMKAEAARMR